MNRTLGLTAATLAAIGLILALTTPAVAQSDAARAIYTSGATIQTNIAGIHSYPEPPVDFSPLTASDEMLATYGFPPRPDKLASPQKYATWQKAMLTAKHRQTGELKPHSEAMSHPVQLNKIQPQNTGGSGTPVTYNSLNWSGIANGNTLTKWNTKTSFNRVTSEFNVPVVQQPFGSCDGYVDWEVTWNGIDGFKNDTVLQGGSSSQAWCNNNKASQTYYAWVEWWPSYPIIEVFSVNPGDDIYVFTYSPNGGCNPGYVYVEDMDTVTYGSWYIDWQTGPCLVGNSAEIIVERPWGDNNGFYPLANYLLDFALSWSLEANNSEFGPGMTTPETYLFDMTDDKGDQVISYPVGGGRYSAYFYDANCALSGGCTF